MPGISGLDVTRAMRQEQPSLPVIVMTAFGSIETAVEAIHEGAYDYVSKPMNLDELKKNHFQGFTTERSGRPASQEDQKKARIWSNRKP